jgi:hypothetical protein
MSLSMEVVIGLEFINLNWVISYASTILNVIIRCIILRVWDVLLFEVLLLEA